MTEKEKMRDKLTPATALLAAAGVLGALLIVIAAGFLTPAETGGVTAIATPRSCDWLLLDGAQYVVCSDGSQWEVSPLATAPPTQP